MGAQAPTERTLRPRAPVRANDLTGGTPESIDPHWPWPGPRVDCALAASAPQRAIAVERARSPMPFPHGAQTSRALGPLAQFHGHHRDGALVDLGAVPFAQDDVIGRTRFPALTGLPAVPLEKVGRRGQHVRHAALQVAAPIAIEIDGILVVARWQ